MNKTAGVSLVRRMAAGVLVAVSLTSSFVASAAWHAALAVTTTPLTPYLDKGYAIAPNKSTQSIVCFDASKEYSSTSKAPTAWSFTATDAGSAFKSVMSDSEGPLSNPDEAKLRDGGRTLLLTGSYISGWAEIDVATKQARRYMRDTTTYNTHSIEKLPDGTLVTANSTGDGTYNNCLVLITTDASGNHTYKKAFELYGAHGVEWDENRNCLWACGNSASDWKGRATLYKLTYDPTEKTLTQVDSIQYKSDNNTTAHGLRLSADGSIYCTAHRIYKVDPDTKTVTEVLYPPNQAKGVHYDSTYGMVYQISGYLSDAGNDTFLNDHVTVIPVSGEAYGVYPQDAPHMYKVAWALSTPAMYVPYISSGESFWCGGDGSLADANCANDVRTAAKAAFKSGNRLVFGGYESPDITVGAATSAAGITAAHGTTTLAGAGSLALSGTVDTGDEDAVVIIRTPVSGALTKVGKGTLVLEGTLAGVTALDIQAGTVAISNALPKGVTATVAPGATFIDGSPAVAAVDRLVVTAQPQEYAVPGAPYGVTDGYEEGTPYTKTISAEPLALETGVRVRCVGWKLYKQNADGKTWDDWQTGAGSSVTYTHPDCSVRLVWQFAKEYNVTFATSPADCGTLSEPTGWYFEGTNLSISASTAGTGGLVFWRWTGDVTSTDNPLALAVNGPKTLTANYRDLTQDDPSVVRPGDDVEQKMAALRTEWETDGKAKTLTLLIGTHTLAHELYIDFPLTLRGETGNPDDVVLQGDKTFRILTINHADAEVKDLTIAKGHFANESGIYGFGNSGVRICKPLSLDRTNKIWDACEKGAGGRLTHCIVRDCETINYKCWGVVYLNGPKDKTFVDRCVIRDNYYEGQQNGDSCNGDIVTVTSGHFMNSLVCNNLSGFSYAGVKPGDDKIQGCVTVNGADGEIVGCTVVRNRMGDSSWKKYPGHQVSGICATAGKVVNCIVAFNTNDDPWKPEHLAWGGVADCFVNCLTDTSNPVNGTCLATAIPGFVDAAAGNYRLFNEAPAAGFGSTVSGAELGDLDLAGNARTRGETVDAGAYALAEGGTKVVSFEIQAEGEAREPANMRFVGLTAGLGYPLKYLWDFDSDGTVDLVSDTNVVAATFQSGTYTVTLTVTNELSGVSKAATIVDALKVKYGSYTHEVSAAAGSNALQEKIDWIKAQYGATEVPQTIRLQPGTYALKEELYLDWPLTVVGATGDPEDVVVEGDKTFRLCTINHADAELRDLTLAKGHFANESGIYGFGNSGVRICKPQNLDRTNKSWDGCQKGDGGRLTHCIVRDCETINYKCWGVVYLNGPKDKTFVDRCVIRDNYYEGQQNGGSGNGDIVTVTSGHFMNSLVCDNLSVFGYAGVKPADDTIQGCVTVNGADGEIVGCTVVRNRMGDGAWKKHPGHQVAGICATAGKVVNCVVAFNTNDDPWKPEHLAWGGVADCFVNCIVDVATLPGETCSYSADPGFLNPAGGCFAITRDSACYCAGTTEASCQYGALDLSGVSRVRTVGETQTIDVGAYQQDPTATSQSAACTVPEVRLGRATIHCSATAYGFGDSPLFCWDFNGDGVIDFVTTESAFDRTLGVGSYDVRLSISNLVDNVGKTIAADNGTFAVAPRPVHYVDAAGKNPVSPYSTPETAATDVQSAIDAAEAGHEVRILPGDYPISIQVVVNKELVVGGSTGRPEDVVIRAVTSTNRCMMVNAGPEALVHSLTLADGRPGPGTPISKDYCSTLAAGLCIANVGLSNAGDMRTGTQLGGTVSNCVIRGAYVHAKYCEGCGVYAYGPNAFLTHCVISNNVSTAGFADSGNFCAVGLALKGGARAENCLVADNRTGSSNDSGFYHSAVYVDSDSVLRFSTVVGNTCAMVGGVNVYGTGRCEACVIAGNSINRSDTTDPRHRVWGCFPSTFARLPASKNAENLATEATLAATVGAQLTTNAVDMAGSGLGAGTVETTVDRLIRRMARRDFRLAAGSPAKDRVPASEKAGMPTMDLLGNPRLSGAGYDLGAYETVLRGLMLIVR